MLTKRPQSSWFLFGAQHGTLYFYPIIVVGGYEYGEPRWAPNLDLKSKGSLRSSVLLTGKFGSPCEMFRCAILEHAEVIYCVISTSLKGLIAYGSTNV